MLISDWSSDVCSSDLLPLELRRGRRLGLRLHPPFRERREEGHRFGAGGGALRLPGGVGRIPRRCVRSGDEARSEEHTSELQSLMRISYAVFCLKKKIHNKATTNQHST